MKTHPLRYYSLLALGLLLMEVAGAYLLWRRHEQWQYVFSRRTQVRVQQKATQAWGERPVILNELQDNIKAQDHQNSKDRLNSMLTEAATKGQLDSARQLIKQGAEVNRQNFDEREDSPLLHAVEAHQNAMVRLLLAHGAECNFTTGGTTPLICAAEQGDNAIVKQLLAHGAHVDDRVKLGSALVFAAEAGHLNVVRTLVEAGAEINTCITKTPFCTMQ